MHEIFPIHDALKRQAWSGGCGVVPCFSPEQ